MANKVTLTNLVNLQNETTAVTAINSNNAALITALNNTLSRDGTSPNQMGATLDMNSNRIINLPTPTSALEPVRLQDVTNPVTIPLTFTQLFAFGGRIAKTANYTVLSADTGNIIALNTNFFTLTFGTPSGYTATHNNIVVNEDTVRAKSIVITGGTTFTLYPGQSAVVFNDNNVWKVIKENRWKCGTCTLFVDPALGSDSNDGLAAGTGGAFLTVQKAWDIATDGFDLGAGSLIIQLADGTYTSGIISQKPMHGGGAFQNVVIKGNTATPANVLFNTSLAGVGVFEFGVGASSGPVQVQIQDLEVRNAGASGSGIQAWGPGVFIWFQNIRFGTVANNHIAAQHGAIIMGTSLSYAVTGNANIHILAQTTGQVYVHGSTITFSNSPVWTTAGLYAAGLGNIYAGGMTFTNGGTVTGPRFSVNTNGNINIAGGGTSYFPGVGTGSVSLGGQYN